MPPNAKLREVLQHHAIGIEHREEKIAFLKKLIGEDVLEKLTVGEAFQEGHSLGFLERRISLDGCSTLEQLWFDSFLVDCDNWSKRKHKIPRIEEPHNRFDAVGTPSTFGTNSAGGWPEKQENSSLEVMCGRPSKSFWINARIMHPVFNEMMEALKENSVPEPSDFKLARALTRTMPSSFLFENSRRDEINHILDDHLKLGIKVQSISSFVTDGTSFPSGLNVEYKNEKGLGKSDPYMQNIGYYVHYWSRSDGPKRHCCPWIIMEVLGQEIGLSAAVWACGRPAAQPLSPNVPFLPVPSDKDIFRMQARLCKALRVGTTTLRNFYQTAGSIQVTPQAGFPYPRIVCFDGKTEQVELEYTGILNGAKEARKMLFLAKRKDTQESVLVKFTDRYGKEVHEALATEALAPALHYVESHAGLVMVVMELLTDCHMWNKGNRTKEHVLKLEKAGTILEKNGYVHGDLRPPNVHTKGENIYILDFDWAGNEDDVVYPDVLNPTQNWHQDAKVGLPIRKEHDKFMIENLCK